MERFCYLTDKLTFRYRTRTNPSGNVWLLDKVKTPFLDSQSSSSYFVKGGGGGNVFTKL